MLIKQVKVKGVNLNCLKFKRIIGKDGKLGADNIHVVLTNVELMKMYEMLHKKFGNKERLMAVKIPKRKVAPKKVAPKKPETVALFGCFGEEIEV